MPATSHLLLTPSWRYLHLQALQSDPKGRTTPVQVSALTCREVIAKALAQLHGIVGAGIPVDFLREVDSTGCFILRCPASDAAALQSAISLYTHTFPSTTDTLSLALLAVHPSLHQLTRLSPL